MKQDVMLERPIQGGTEVLSPPYYEEQILPTATQWTWKLILLQMNLEMTTAFTQMVTEAWWEVG